MKTRQLIFRWSLVTGGLIALFWAIYYLIAGNVPIITNIKTGPNWIIVLPFGISRWWDILIGPIWSTIIVLLLTSKELTGDKSLGAGLIFGVIIGLGAGLIFGVIIGLVTSLLVTSLVVGLIAGLGDSLATLIKWVTNSNPWTKVWDWLLVR